MAAPHSDSAAPISATLSTRGRRTLRMMFLPMPAGTSSPRSARQITDTVSESGMDTLPTQTHSSIAAISAAVMRIYMPGGKRSVFIPPAPPRRR